MILSRCVGDLLHYILGTGTSINQSITLHYQVHYLILRDGSHSTAKVDLQTNSLGAKGPSLNEGANTVLIRDLLVPLHPS